MLCAPFVARTTSEQQSVAYYNTAEYMAECSSHEDIHLYTGWP